MGKNLFCLFLFVLLTACSPSSVDDFRHEGESLCKALTKELKDIESHEQLIKKAPKIKIYFDQLSSLMIKARELEPAEEISPIVEEETVAGKALLHELKRIYQLEAGREVIEKAQKEALIKLFRTPSKK